MYHTKTCPHDCLACTSNDGLTRETAIKIVCPICNTFAAVMHNDIFCNVCSKYFEYEFQDNFWYMYYTNTKCHTNKYYDGYWYFE